ncbi:unnamed protein product [Urochloa decumbens]|uniref:Uncharacterized protein n=1 Tax=Urochloa decumbens TaxID=240449 RepID=A0ABC8VIK7_9POAL
MSAVVIKSSPVVVRPSSPASTAAIKLSSFDKGLERMPITALLVFEHPIHETAETIKTALSRALVHYYPFAGRIVAAGDGYIQCGGEGVVELRRLRRRSSSPRTRGGYTRAAMSDPEAPAALFFSANARRLVGAKEGYYDNCVTAAQVVAERSGAVAGGDVVELVKKIRDAKERIPDQLKKNNKDEGGGDLPELRDRYDMVFVSSWPNLGFDEVDFGGGTPARVTSRMRERPHFPAFRVITTCCPSPSRRSMLMPSSEI